MSLAGGMSTMAAITRCEQINSTQIPVETWLNMKMMIQRPNSGSESQQHAKSLYIILSIIWFIIYIYISCNSQRSSCDYRAGTGMCSPSFRICGTFQLGHFSTAASQPQSWCCRKAFSGSSHSNGPGSSMISSISTEGSSNPYWVPGSVAMRAVPNIRPLPESKKMRGEKHPPTLVSLDQTNWVLA